MRMRSGIIRRAIRLGAMPAALALLCTSCSTTLSRDDGLIGLVTSLARKDEGLRLDNPVEEIPAAAAATNNPAAGAGPGAAATEPVGAPPPLVYRTSPGDSINVAFYRRTATDTSELYRVQSGDVLGIHVSGSGAGVVDVSVRPDGNISYFQSGDLPVRGQSIPAVRTQLLARVREVTSAADVTVFLKRPFGPVEDFLDDLKSDLDNGTARSMRVKWDGRACFPLIGEVPVVGKTLAEFGAELEARYAAVLGGGLSVSVNVISEGTGNLAILGEVRKPGLYTVYGPIHPLEAIAMAGGALDTGDLRRLLVLRPDAGGALARHQPFGNGGGAAAVTQPHDILILPKSAIANVNQFVDQYIRQVLPFRMSLGAHYSLSND